MIKRPARNPEFSGCAGQIIAAPTESGAYYRLLRFSSSRVQGTYAAGRAASVEVEVWGLDKAAVGHGEAALNPIR